MNSFVEKIKDKEEYYFQEGCFITELSNSEKDKDISIAKARVEVGKTTRWHKLQDTTERYVIISGIGRVQIGDSEPIEVRAGDIVNIAPMCKQRITNIGEEDLIFLAICSPRFQEQNYIEV